MYSIFLAVGPLIVLIVLNSCIILVTVYVSKKRSVISRINNHYTHPEQRRKNSATTLTVPIQRTNNATRTCARHLAANGNSKQEFTAGNGRKSSFPTTTSLSVNVAMETAFRRASTTSSAAHLRASSVASSSSIASSATSGDDNMALVSEKIVQKISRKNGKIFKNCAMPKLNILDSRRAALHLLQHNCLADQHF